MAQLGAPSWSPARCPRRPLAPRALSRDRLPRLARRVGRGLVRRPSRRPAFLRYRPALPVTPGARPRLHRPRTLAAVRRLRARRAHLARRHLRGAGRRRDGEGPPGDPLARGTVILAVTAASAAVAWFVPLFSLPEPTGPHKVGTRWIVLTDSSRFEMLAPSPGGKRQLIVRVWFPADSVAGASDDYIESDVAKGIATGLKLPSFALSHLTNISTHSYRRAWLPSQPQRFPLILFSHGYGVGTESQNTVQMEELASHGFVVASIDHPYEAGAILMPDGKVALANPPFNPADSASLTQALAAITQLQQATDTSAMLGPLRTMYANSAPLDTSIVRWTDDTRFVLDQITAMSAPHMGGDTLFAGRLATDKVGLLGMSFGGATAAAFCTIDTRCAAGMNLDGLHYGVAAREPLPRPFFIASSQKNTNVHRLFYERATAPVSLMTVTGSEHMDYTDFSWIAPKLAARTGMLGGIAPARMHALMNAVIVPYFDAALRGGTGIDRAALTARYPEITLLSRSGAAVSPPAATQDSATTRR
ncbi:MAG: hypothetical protein IPF47_14745 [Gemmatimonadetes bacterium]|nr:hypothetical protein [Gemmatimonadota bacterium]